MKALFFLAGRFLWSRKKEQGLTAPLLSLAGLTVGVLALNTVLSVMNGFQLTFIESLLEVSSSHLRWETSGPADPDLVNKIRVTPGIRSIQPFYEAQTLIQGPTGGQRGAFLRGQDTDALTQDTAMASHLSVVGRARLAESGEVLLGSPLAAALGVGLGDTVSFLALSGPSFSLLSPQKIDLKVVGTFTTGYYEIDSSWALVSLADAQAHFAGTGDFHYGIKLFDENQDQVFRDLLASKFSLQKKDLVSWREFNSAFFGALKTEKTAMMVLIGLIFVVVGVNIFFAMRRTVQGHREDIALFQAVGLSPARIRGVFAAEGALLGLVAALLGTVLGVGFSLAIPLLLSPQAFYLPKLPSRLIPHEVVIIAAAAIAASTFAAWTASRPVQRIPIAEVLKTE